jgi:hypothetical protein
MRRYGTDEASGQKNVLLYVAPGSVRYTAEDIDLLLPWLMDLREGVGPHDPRATTGGNRGGTKDFAHYEAWCAVGAEIDRRLAKTGVDRFLVETYYTYDWLNCHTDDEKLDYLRNLVDTPRAEIWRRIKSAVSYISSGPCPRWLNCIDCSRYARCRRKKRPGVTYKEWKGHRRTGQKSIRPAGQVAYTGIEAKQGR